MAARVVGVHSVIGEHDGLQTAVMLADAQMTKWVSDKEDNGWKVELGDLCTHKTSIARGLFKRRIQFVITIGYTLIQKPQGTAKAYRVPDKYKTT